MCWGRHKLDLAHMLAAACGQGPGRRRPMRFRWWRMHFGGGGSAAGGLLLLLLRRRLPEQSQSCLAENPIGDLEQREARAELRDRAQRLVTHLAQAHAQCCQLLRVSRDRLHPSVAESARATQIEGAQARAQRLRDADEGVVVQHAIV